MAQQQAEIKPKWQNVSENARNNTRTRPNNNSSALNETPNQENTSKEENTASPPPYQPPPPGYAVSPQVYAPLPPGYGPPPPGYGPPPPAYGPPVIQQPYPSSFPTGLLQTEGQIISVQRPKDYLVLSIISFLFFWPLSICALISSLRSRRAAREFDFERAQKLGETAKMLSVASILIGVIVIIISMSARIGRFHRQTHG